MTNFNYKDTDQNYQDEQVTVWFEQEDSGDVYGVVYGNDSEPVLVYEDGEPVQNEQRLLDGLVSLTTLEMQSA